MRDVLGEFWAIDSEAGRVKESNWRSVAEGPATVVKSYAELAEHVASLSFFNPQFNLFYRGQTQDHYRVMRRDSGESCSESPKYSSLMPSIYRNCCGDKLLKAFDCLKRKEECLLKEIDKLRERQEGMHERTLYQDTGNFREIHFAILQHYGIPTPLLDVTLSLPVACSFAYYDYDKATTGDDPHVYVIAMPGFHGQITFHGYEGLVIVNLRAACPPKTKRPHHQEAFAIGSVPHTSDITRVKWRDFSHRMIGKFKIADVGEFWKTAPVHGPFRREHMMPQEDDFLFKDS